VLIIERWLLGRLRHRRFYSLAELNTAIGECCGDPASVPLNEVVDSAMGR